MKTDCTNQALDSLSNALCSADFFKCRGELCRWIAETIDSGAPIYGQFNHLLQKAEHRLSFDIAQFSARGLDESEPPWFASLRVDDDPIETPTISESPQPAVIDYAKLTQLVDAVVAGLATGARNDILDDTFKVINHRLSSAGNDRDMAENQELAIVSAQFNLIAGMREVCARGNHSRESNATFENAVEWALYSDRTEVVAQWLENKLNSYPQLLKFVPEAVLAELRQK